MQPTQHTLHRLRLVVLHEGHVEAMLLETLLVVALEEIAAFIQKHVGLNDQEVFYFGFDYLNILFVLVETRLIASLQTNDYK